MPITITGLSSSIRNLSRDFDQETERELRSRALQAFAEVRAATPVDTGRARNSWSISYQVEYNSNGASANLVLAPSNELREINITNGVGYIEFLNDGHSDQAPTKFIEQVFSRYFDTVQVTVVPGEINT